MSRKNCARIMTAGNIVGGFDLGLAYMNFAEQRWWLGGIVLVAGIFVIWATIRLRNTLMGVSCGECKWYTEPIEGIDCGRCIRRSNVVWREDSCSYGKAKEKEEEE